MHQPIELMRFFNLLLLLVMLPATASAEQELLRPEQAFRVVATEDGSSLDLRWTIADGYYLYKNKFRFRSETPGIELGEPEYPPAEIRHDEFFGDVEIYRGDAAIRIPVLRQPGGKRTLVIETRSQGCADIGVCYPPQTQKLNVALAEASASPPPPTETGGGLKALARLGEQLGLGSEDELLPADEAFLFSAAMENANTLRAHWQIAKGYYLYRDKIELSVTQGDATLGTFDLPAGSVKEGVRPDGSFGPVATLHGEIDLLVPIQRSSATATDITVLAKYQGCAERGVCYPPISKRFPFSLPTTALATTTIPTAAPPPAGPPISEQDRFAQLLGGGSLWAIVIGFLGAGVLLAFTACMYPMIPILSSIIVGEGREVTNRRALLLSLAYVEAMALTYAAVGVASAHAGAGLQGFFQSAWVITAFAAVFVLLALSMFGFYDLQIPAGLQGRLSALSNRQKGGTYVGAAIMGVLSALIIGPCAGPVLFAALVYTSQTGDDVIGGLAMLAMGNGIGLPLLVIGASGGQLLPKAGPWMSNIKGVFGVVLLAVAIVMLERVWLGPFTLMLWALLFVIPAIYLGALEPVQVEAGGWKKLWKGLGVAMLGYGAILMVSAASGGRDVLQPLHKLTGGIAMSGTTPAQAASHLPFKRIKSVADLERELGAAAAQGRHAMLDFYADWCTYCIKMEQYTFSDGRVQTALSDVLLLQADVTANDPTDLALLNRFGLFTPPAILFFGPDGAERRAHRLVGDTDADAFLAHLGLALQ